MTNLLYITVNSKPEDLSTSKTIGRALVNQIKSTFKDVSIEELDLYREHIPRLEYALFESKNCLIKEDAFDNLQPEVKKEAIQVIKLVEQFKKAEIYVFAAPMWSLSFPAPLKEYLDCIIQVGKTITFDGQMPKGLLDDKERIVFYVQSSGGHVPWVMRPIFNKGLNYVEDMMKFMGIKDFVELLVDGTGTTEMERLEAIDKAREKIPQLIKHIRHEEILK